MTSSMLGTYTAGLLTFLTPCVLPVIPIYLSVLLGGPLSEASESSASRLRLFGHTLLFTLGFLVVFVALGLSATAVGRLFGSYREVFTLLGGLLIFLFGLKFMGYLQIHWLDQDKRLDSHKLNLSTGVLNSVVMGFVFALGWTPCVGPILGAVLTYTASSTNFSQEVAVEALALSTHNPFPPITFDGTKARKSNHVCHVPEHSSNRPRKG